jgi:DNA mismatch repair protein MutS2
MRYMEVYDIFLDRLPRIDLHGYDRDSARVMVNDFVDEAIAMRYDEILIVHGIGSGIVKESVLRTLSLRKDILNFYVAPENIGCTVVEIK